MNRLCRYLIITILLIHGLNVSAQRMEITNAATSPLTPEKLIREIFLGSGVEVINVRFDGDPKAIGYFTKASNVIGIERGILLTTGSAVSTDCKNASLAGADCGGLDIASVDNSSNATDKDLEDISKTNIEDAAIFEISFIPKAEKLRFNYVFASEEYPEWSCTQFNDVFGFFISGPGINGPYQNKAKNIALIPGTNLPVTINNVHPGDPSFPCAPKFAQFYNSNFNTSIQPVYDGFLNVFTAEADVTPCQTYTIKIAIGDVADSFWDSGVFLEAKSFGTTSLEAVYSTFSRDNIITEGCESAKLNFSLNQTSADDYPLAINLIGTARNGEDFKALPSNIFIPKGQKAITLEIEPIEDNLNEAQESVGVVYQKNLCEKDTIWINIQDNVLKANVTTADTSICEGKSVQLQGNISVSSSQEFVFRNSNRTAVSNSKAVYSSLNVTGVKPSLLSPGVIKSVCVNIQHNRSEDLDIYLISPAGHFLELSTDNGADCDNYNNVCFSASATQLISSGEPWPFCSSGQVTPFSGKTYKPEGVWSDLWNGKYPVNGTWQLLILDDQAGIDGTLNEWSLTFESWYSVNSAWVPAESLSCTACINPVAAPTTTTTFQFIAQDNFGCHATDSVRIDVSRLLPAPVINCSEITPSSLSFDWTDVQGATGYKLRTSGQEWIHSTNLNLTYAVNNLKPGDAIQLEVEPIGDCGGKTATKQCFIPNCAVPEITIGTQSNISCAGKSDGSITLMASGSGSPFTFTLGNVTNQTGIFNGLSVGNYSVSVVDNLGCSASKKFQIHAPDSLKLSSLTTPTGCSGNQSGAIDITVSGGTGPYNFGWSNGATTEDLFNLSAGTYFVTATDKNGCTATHSGLIQQSQPITLSHVQENNNCFGAQNGKITLSVSGGVGTYQYFWTGPSGFASDAKDLSSLKAGTYSLKVSDRIGCTAGLSVDITEPPSPLVVTIAKPVDICFGAKNGKLETKVTGGTMPYGYFWSNGQTAAISTGLSAETYTVTVIDSKGCIQITEGTVTQSARLEVELGQNQVSCYNGKDGAAFVTKINQGGTAIDTSGFRYNWSIPNQSQAKIINLQAGQSYRITVTNTAGCTATSAITIGNPPPLQASILETVELNCADGKDAKATASGSGGTPPYSYLWSQNSGGQSSPTASALGAGLYRATVTDSKGCTAQTEVNLVAPQPMTAIFDNKPVSCYGGNDGLSTAKIEGGFPPYQFVWSPGATSHKLTNSTAGSYQLSVTDAKGCRQIFTTQIAQPDTSVHAVVLVDDITCYGLKNGRITLTANGGSPPYSYSSDGKSFNNSSVFIALPAGTHTAFVRDRNGCLYQTVPVLVKQPFPFEVYLGKDTLVNFGATLRLTPFISAKDSLLIFQYKWSSSNPVSPVVNSGPTGEITVKGPTTATLTVTDSKGCEATDAVNIQVFEYRSILVPRAFAPGPGGSAKNDKLHVHGNSFLVDKIRLFRIFNRQGAVLFEASDFSVNENVIGWDGTFRGKEMPAGVYAWLVEVDFIDGSTEVYKGHTTLFR